MCSGVPVTVEAVPKSTAPFIVTLLKLVVPFIVPLPLKITAPVPDALNVPLLLKWINLDFGGAGNAAANDFGPLFIADFAGDEFAVGLKGGDDIELGVAGRAGDRR